MKKTLASTIILAALIIGTACNVSKLRTVNRAEVPTWIGNAVDALGTAVDFVNFVLGVGGGDGFWPTSIG